MDLKKIENLSLSDQLRNGSFHIVDREGVATKFKMYKNDKCLCNCETNIVHCCVSRHSRSSISRRGSGIIESQLFINPSIFPSYSLFMIEIVMMFDVHYSFSETVKFFIPIVRTLNVPYSFSMLSRYSLLRFHPPSILIST